MTGLCHREERDDDIGIAWCRFTLIRVRCIVARRSAGVKNFAMKLSKISCRALLVVVLAATNVYADQLTVDQSDARREGQRPSIIVPYAFSTEALKTGVGAVYYRKGAFQSHDGFFLTGYGTSNTSFGLFGGMTNLQLSKRLFFNPTIGFMSNDQQRFYGDLGFEIGGAPPSGSNESDENDFVFGSGIDSYLHLTFRYVLPIGAGSDPQPHRYTPSVPAATHNRIATRPTRDCWPTDRRSWATGTRPGAVARSLSCVPFTSAGPSRLPTRISTCFRRSCRWSRATSPTFRRTASCWASSTTTRTS
jgi:hypothetical protein